MFTNDLIFSMCSLHFARWPAQTAGRRRREWKNAWKSGKAAAGCLYGAICTHLRKYSTNLHKKLRHTPFARISGIFEERAEASFVLDFSFFLSSCSEAEIPHLLRGKRTKPFYKGQQETNVDVSGWTPGIYIAVVYSDGSARGKAKFVVK